MRCNRRFEIRDIHTNALILVGYGSRSQAVDELRSQSSSSATRIVWG